MAPPMVRFGRSRPPRSSQADVAADSDAALAQELANVVRSAIRDALSEGITGVLREIHETQQLCLSQIRDMASSRCHNPPRQLQRYSSNLSRSTKKRDARRAQSSDSLMSVLSPMPMMSPVWTSDHVRMEQSDHARIETVENLVGMHAERLLFETSPISLRRGLTRDSSLQRHSPRQVGYSKQPSRSVSKGSAKPQQPQVMPPAPPALKSEPCTPKLQRGRTAPASAWADVLPGSTGSLSPRLPEKVPEKRFAGQNTDGDLLGAMSAFWSKGSEGNMAATFGSYWGKRSETGGTCDLATKSEGAPATGVQSITFDMVTVRHEHERILTSVLFNGDEPVENQVSFQETMSFKDGRGSLPFGLFCGLYLYGVVPSKSKWVWFFRRAAIVLATLACAGWLAAEIFQHPAPRYVNTQDVVCAFGGAVALLSLRGDGIRFLISHNRSPLEAYASFRGFLDFWRVRSCRISMVVFVTWILDGIMHVAIAKRYADELGVLTLLISMFSGSLFACLVCFHLHVCEALRIMVDDFCTQFFAQEPDFCRGMREWNKLQAVLRQAGRSIDTCCLVLATSTLAAGFIDGAAIVLDEDPAQIIADRFLLQVVPSIMKVMLAVFCFYQAAMISEKCTQAPPLVNSVMGPDNVAEMDPDRQYLVQYMENSAAGFYIKGVRINSFMVMKVSYVVASALLFLALRASHA